MEVATRDGRARVRRGDAAHGTPDQFRTRTAGVVPAARAAAIAARRRARHR